MFAYMWYFTIFHMYGMLANYCEIHVTVEKKKEGGESSDRSQKKKLGTYIYMYNTQVHVVHRIYIFLPSFGGMLAMTVIKKTH